jgi:hypothetical protein
LIFETKEIYLYMCDIKGTGKVIPVQAVEALKVARG